MVSPSNSRASAGTKDASNADNPVIGVRSFGADPDAYLKKVLS